MPMSFGEYAAFLTRSLAKVEPEMIAATEAVMEVAKKGAQQVIGTYDSGWEKLHDTTLNGWQGFPGKVQLGYSPPDNPLLRTGQLRAGIEAAVIPMRSEVIGAIGSDDKVAVYHEFGTSKMAARPFLAWGMKEAILPASHLYMRLVHNLFVPGDGR